MSGGKRLKGKGLKTTKVIKPLMDCYNVLRYK